MILAAAGFGAVVQKMSKKFMGNQEQLQNKNAAFVETITELHNGFHEIHVNQMETLAENDFKKQTRIWNKLNIHVANRE